MAYRIIPRSEWGARYPDGFRPAPLPAGEVWLHHSVTAQGSGSLAGDKAAVRTLETIGQQRFGGGISYTWPVTRSGRIFTGHSPGRQGAHTGGRNDIARAICLIGNYDTSVPTSPQLDAVAWLLGEAKRRGWIKHARLNGGHRDAPGAATICPGRHAWALISEINRRAAGGAGGGGGDMLSDADLDRAARHTVRWVSHGNKDETQKYSLDTVLRRIAALRDLVAQQAGLTEQQITAAVRAGQPTREELIDMIRDALADAGQEITQETVEAAIRSVLGTLDDQEETTA